MRLRYTGRAFREQHGVGLRELGRGANIRAATLVDWEYDRAAPDTADLGQIIAYFRQRDIPCGLEDLVEEIADEDEEEQPHDG